MESSKLIKVKTYIVSRSVVAFIQLLNIITINQRAFFCHQILLQCVDFFTLGYSPLLRHFCSFFSNHLPSPSPQNAPPTVELLFCPFFSFCSSDCYRSFYLATPAASYFLSSRPTFGLIAIPATLVLLHPRAPHGSYSVPLINSQIPAYKETLRV